MPIDALTIPSTYARLIIELCDARGIAAQSITRHLDPAVLNDPNGRLPLLEVGALLYQAFRLDEAIGYEIGLNTQMTSHGFVGYGVMTYPTVGDAIDFGIRNADLRTPFVSLRRYTEDETCIIEVRETFDLGPARRVGMEHFLIGIWSMARLLSQSSGQRDPGFELHFDYPEPACHQHYRSRLPPCHFSSVGNQLRFPAKFLAVRLATADGGAATMATQQCERERLRSGELAATLTARVQAILDDTVAPPPLGAMAEALHLSPRSLKRKLGEEGNHYQALVDQHRERLARRRLRNTRLRISDIAAELGYQVPANFSRAFRKWTGMSPAQMRAQIQASAARSD